MSNQISRRQILQLALSSSLVALAPRIASASRTPQRLDEQTLSKALSRIISVDGENLDRVRLIRTRRGQTWQSLLINRGEKSVRVKEVVLFDLELALPSTTRLYGEGFQMLTQTGGTLGHPSDLGNYTDAKHYKIPSPEGYQSLYGMMMLTTPDNVKRLLGFTSCSRFVGKFYLKDDRLKVVIDTEGLELRPGESWKLETFLFQSGPDREKLLDGLSTHLVANHRPLKTTKPPTGWCSWYCFGPRVTAKQVLDNLDFISKRTPGLRYIQIDDGYQPAMGDWLETGAAFGGDVQGVLKEIRKRGFEPAIWVAPFVAEEKSHVFQQHPDWFVKNAEGRPLRSDTVTFGGWRRGPWYVLDGTNPQVQRHFESLFRTMKREWGCTYFKLDANFWGAIHGGTFHDSSATRVEAYRRGMQAILRGAEDSFILGCNHPIWASLGLIHGSRSSNDIKRTWDRIETTARQNLSRNWQNGRLWWNDPDAVVLTGDLPENEFLFHATSIFASGGMVLSGDDLTTISADRLAILRKLQPPTGVAARFDDDSFTVGRMNLPGRQIVSILNWTDGPQSISFKLWRRSRVTDFWTETDFGTHTGNFQVPDMPARSGRLLICS